MVEGVGHSFGNGVSAQQATVAAGASYKRKFGEMPTHVALPVTLDPGDLELWTLIQVEPRGTASVVIVGHLLQTDDGGKHAF